MIINKVNRGRRNFLFSGLLGRAALLMDKWLRPLRKRTATSGPEIREAMFYRVERDDHPSLDHQD